MSRIESYQLSAPAHPAHNLVSQSESSREAAAKNESIFLKMAESAPVMIWMADVNLATSYFNKQWLTFTGRTLEEEKGEGWTRGVYPADLESCLATYRESFAKREHFTMEYRLKRADGEYRWILDNGVPLFSTDGSFLGYVGTCVDITSQKLIQEEHRGHARFLFTSIEQERIRIARELHDAIGQTLTLLSFDVIRTQQNLSGYDPEISERLTGMYHSIQGMVTTVQRICSNLRPSILDNLGLSDAIDWISEDFSRRRAIPCLVAWNGDPCKNELCATDIFRIVQESLTNIAKYSGATEVRISFTRHEDGYLLEIADNGIGFDLNSIPEGHGFGIIGMRERALSLNASFEISTGRGDGTTVILHIPCGTKGCCHANSDS